MKKLWLLLVLLLFSLTSHAEDITIVTTEWTDYTNPDGTGLYYDTANAVFKAAGINVNYVVRPYARAAEELHTKNYDGLMGFSATDASATVIVADEWPLEVGSVAVLSHSNNPYTSDNSYKAKKVGWIRGYEFENMVTTPKAQYSIFELQDLESGIKMMDKGRLDFILDYSIDLELLIKGKESKYNIKEVYPETVVMGFHNNAEGKDLLSTWNEQMEQLYNSGELNAIFQKNGFGDYIRP